MPISYVSLLVGSDRADKTGAGKDRLKYDEYIYIQILI